MQKTGKLELTWVDKYEDDRLEPRILIEDMEKSYGDASSDNMLIHGDNLLALKALERDFTGKVRCIYIVIWTTNMVGALSSQEHSSSLAA